MQTQDKAEFFKALNLCYSTLQKPLPEADALKLWIKLLEPYSLADVKAALLQHMSENKFAPVPADVIGRVDTRIDGWPGENESWAIAKLAYAKPGEAERNTVAICNEIEQALDAVRHLIDEGDFSAPKAFKETYTRIVGVERKTRPVPRWRISLGTDNAQREQVVQKAVYEGRIALADGRAISPALVGPGDNDAIDEATAGENRSRLAGVLAMLKKPEAKPARDMATDVASTRAAAADQQRKVDEYLDREVKTLEARKRELAEREAALAAERAVFEAEKAALAAEKAALGVWIGTHVEALFCGEDA